MRAFNTFKTAEKRLNTMLRFKNKKTEMQTAMQKIAFLYVVSLLVQYRL